MPDWSSAVAELVRDLDTLRTDLEITAPQVRNTEALDAAHRAERDAIQAVRLALGGRGAGSSEIESTLGTARAAMARAKEVIGLMKAEIARSRGNIGRGRQETGRALQLRENMAISEVVNVLRKRGHQVELENRDTSGPRTGWIVVDEIAMSPGQAEGVAAGRVTLEGIAKENRDPGAYARLRSSPPRR